MRRVALSLFPLISLAHAQTGRAFPTLDALVGCARSVHVGRIESVSPVKFPIPEGGFYPGKPYLVRVRVSETIKGASALSLNLVMTVQHTHELDYFRNHRTELFISASQVTNRRTSTYQCLRQPGIQHTFRILEPLRVDPRAKDAWVGQQVNIDDDEGRIFDLALNVVKGRDTVLRRAREMAAKYGPAEREQVSFSIPNQYAVRVGYPNAFAVAIWPKVPEREAVLTGLLSNPDRILKHVARSARPQVERGLLVAAMRSLIEFPSDANASLVRKVGRRFEALPLQDDRVAYGDVRRVSEEVLKEWGK